MAKKVAVLAVNPVNGCGLFQYLEAFFENGISYKVFAVSDTKEIKTNSGISLTTDDVIANLKGHEDEFDAFVFSCGDAVPVFQQNADKPYNIDLMEVIKTFGDKGKIMIGHCAGAMMFDFTGITKGKNLLNLGLYRLKKSGNASTDPTDTLKQSDEASHQRIDPSNPSNRKPEMKKALVCPPSASAHALPLQRPTGKVHSLNRRNSMGRYSSEPSHPYNPEIYQGQPPTLLVFVRVCFHYRLQTTVLQADISSN